MKIKIKSARTSRLHQLIFEIWFLFIMKKFELGLSARFSTRFSPALFDNL